jgi:hypothetical protein
MNRKHLFVSGGIATIAGLSILAAWGPLDPPEGPITGTYKTLAEVEPRIAVNAQNTPGDANNVFRITKPGSYYLTGNIAGVVDKSGIYIGASRVTLDLNGFTVEGVNGGLYGIHTNANHDVAVRNGTIYNWNIGLQLMETMGCIVDDVRVYDTTEDGFRIGRGGTIRNSTAARCGTGFLLYWDATATGCTATEGPARGFDVGQGSTLTGCIASKNATGFYISGPSVLTGCTSRENSSFGFNIDESGTLTDCSAIQNGSSGFVANARSRLTRCSARSNLEGFYINEANTLTECTAAGNDGSGVRVIGNANTVERGTFHENGDDGIYVFDGKGTTVDGNLSTYNGLVGIRFNAPDNLAVRNRARGNPQGNYSFVANSDYGVILTNPGQGFTSSAAWANFEY